MALPLTCGGIHLIAAYYMSINPERMKGRAGLQPGYSRRSTDIGGHLLAAGREQHRESSPVKDRRSTTASRKQLANAR